MCVYCRMPEGRPYVAADPQLAGRLHAGNSSMLLTIAVQIEL